MDTRLLAECTECGSVHLTLYRGAVCCGIPVPTVPLPPVRSDPPAPSRGGGRRPTGRDCGPRPKAEWASASARFRTMQGGEGCLS